MMNTNIDDLNKKIENALQDIQDNVVEGARGLDRVEIKNHMVFWELGISLKEFIEIESIPEDRIHDELEKNFRKIEKKIRSVGIRKGKKNLPSWKYKNQTVKPPKIQEPSITWVLLSWDFVDEYQDIERWNLVARLSGAMFKEGFVRKRAEELATYFSKKTPPLNAKKLQDQFVQAVSKFKSNPSRKELGLENKSEGLLFQIFGKSKISLSLTKEYFYQIRADVNELLDDEIGTDDSRRNFTNNVGSKPIDFLRRLFRLISIKDEEKFQKRLKGIHLIKTIKTDHHEIKELYNILHSIINDKQSRKKLLEKITSYELLMLNTKLLAITSPDHFQEYQENQKSRNELFN